MDVVTAFLNGELEEEIYMQQPEGYVEPGSEHMACKLKKSLYGLKQSPRCWNKSFVKSMESLDFKQRQADQCIFVNYYPDGKVSIVVHEKTKTESRQKENSFLMAMNSRGANIS